ncbi:MAG: hypothetical protein HY055_10530 [Magnetospirillum sp.]|nr:hypothetical protein [Magnetospirillum sp.]
MRFPLRKLLFGLFCLVAAKSALAAEAALDVLDPPAAYSANFTVSSARGTYHGKVWHMQGLERREVATAGGGQGVLINRGDDTAYLLGLSGKWYVGLSLRAAAGMVGGLDAWKVQRSKLREENVDGQRATRWKTRADGPRGGFAGDIWTNRDGIVVKAAGTMNSADGDDTPVEMVLSEVRVGGVDRRVFELPQGWFGFDLRQVPPEKVVSAVESLKPLLEMRKGR